MVSMKPSESENKAEPAGFRSEIEILDILKFPLKSGLSGISYIAYSCSLFLSEI